MNLSDENDPSKLIPGLAEWNDGRGMDAAGYLGCYSTHALNIAYTTLFWPTFVEHDGCILRGPSVVSSYDAWLESCQGDRSAVERVMNHQHISDVSMNDETPPTHAQMRYLGRVLEEIWRCKLTRDFPNRSFVVKFYDGPFEDTVEYQLTFWQERLAPSAALSE